MRNGDFRPDQDCCGAAGLDRRQTWPHARHAYTACTIAVVLNDSGLVFSDEQFGQRGSADSSGVSDASRTLGRPSGVGVTNISPPSLAASWICGCSKRDRHAAPPKDISFRRKHRGEVQGQSRATTECPSRARKTRNHRQTNYWRRMANGWTPDRRARQSQAISRWTRP